MLRLLSIGIIRRRSCRVARSNCGASTSGYWPPGVRSSSPPGVFHWRSCARRRAFQQRSSTMKGRFGPWSCVTCEASCGTTGGRERVARPCRRARRTRAAEPGRAIARGPRRPAHWFRRRRVLDNQCTSDTAPRWTTRDLGGSSPTPGARVPRAQVSCGPNGTWQATARTPLGSNTTSGPRPCEAAA